MKLAFFGDRHISSKSPRYQHALAMWDFAITDAIEQGATAFIGLGDVCEGDPNGEERVEIGKRYKTMLDHGAVYEVLGNHEHRDALRWLELLGVTVAWNRFMISNLGEATLLLAPYARKGYEPYDQIPAGLSIEDSSRACAARLAEVIARLRQNKTLIVAGHWTVDGMRLGEGDYEIHSAQEMIVPRSAFEGAALVVTGHIHKAQALADEGEVPNILSAGSLYRCSFSEADQPKSYVLVTVDRGGGTWERRGIPCHKMWAETIRWGSTPSTMLVEAWLGRIPSPWPIIVDKEAKLTVEIPEDMLGQFDPSVFEPLRLATHHFVLDKQVITFQRTRAPALVQSETLQEQFEKWLEATGQEVGLRSRELAAKLAELEE